MKKLIIAAVAVLGFGVANAQEVKFGVKAGLNYATLSGDIEETDGLLGFAVGGFLNVKINEKVSFQPELLYSRQGTGSKETETSGTTTFKTDAKLRLDYLNIPLMFRFEVAKGFAVEAGPQIGFLVGANSDFTLTTTQNNNTTVISDSEDVKSDFKSVDFGLNFGAGYDFTQNINVGVRYNLGLTNIAKDSEDFAIRNSVIALAVGYRF